MEDNIPDPLHTRRLGTFWKLMILGLVFGVGTVVHEQSRARVDIHAIIQNQRDYKDMLQTMCEVRAETVCQARLQQLETAMQFGCSM